MKISEFAAMNNVTTKMLRHYDDIDLLKPSVIDKNTGYRSYDAEQSNKLNWIIILKNLDFSLTEIKELLSGPTDSDKFIRELLFKRIEISSSFNEQIQKKVQIDKLIRVLEKEGFKMDKTIDLLKIEKTSVNEIKKNIPNMELFLENVYSIFELSNENDYITTLRFDICQFKQVNDNYGFDVGDKVILAIYTIIKENCDKHFNNFAIGRAHGDEFVVLAKATKVEANGTAKAIIADINTFDFNTLGCNTQMGLYIGGICNKKNEIEEVRKMIENSIETIYKAHKKGKNSIIVE